MSQRQMFLLMLKISGIIVLMISLERIGVILSLVAGAMSDGGKIDNKLFIYIIPHITVMLLQVLAGTYLLLDGRWVCNMCYPPGRKKCIVCGYDFTGSKATRCPECGEESY